MHTLFPKTTASFISTENVTNNNGYQRNSGSGNDAYIVSTKPVNRGNGGTRFTLTGGLATSVFYVGWVTGTPSNDLLSISNYIFGLGINPSDKKLYTIVNGSYGSIVGTGYDCSQFDEVFYYNAYGTIKANIYNGTNTLISGVTILANADLFTNSFTGVTLYTSDIKLSWKTYYESPYTQIINNQVVEVIETPENIIISNLGARKTSIVSLLLQGNEYAYSILGYLNQNYISSNTSDYTFSGSYALQFISLEDVLVEILSMSFLESYDTEVGYKRPIIYAFDNLNADAFDNVFNNVDYPIFISLKNDHELALSSMTIRISSADTTFDASGGISIIMLIEDGV